MSRPPEVMFASARQRELMNYIRAYGAGNVSELSRMLKVSTSTVRRDLDVLREQGLIERHHGGAAPVSSEVLTTWPQREEQRRDEKARIGHAAAALVTDDATLLILGGTTTEAMLPHLSARTGLTVVTNSFVIASRLAALENVEVVVLGGVLRRSEMTMLGSLTIRGLADFGIDMVLTGAFGIDPTLGVTRTNLNEVHTDRSLLESSDQLVVLADHSKFLHRGPARLAPVTSISTLVTDSAADCTTVERFREAGIRVIIA